MGDRRVRGLGKVSIVISGLLLVGLWPAAAFAAGPVDLGAPDIADAVEGVTENVAQVADKAGGTQTVEKVVEQVPDVVDEAAGTVDQVVETVDKVANDAGGAVDKVVEDAGGAVDKVVDDVGGAVDQATDAVDKGSKDASGAANEATGDNSGGGAPAAATTDGSGTGSRQARPGSGRSENGSVKARSTRRSGGSVRQQHRRARGQGRENQPGRPDNPLIGLIEAGNEIGEGVEASATGGQPAAPEQPAQGSGLPFTGGVALFVALAYATLFCGVGSAILAGTRSRGPREFRLLS